MNRRIMLAGKKSYARKLRAIFGSSLIGLWPLNESSGTVAYDWSGNGRNGAYSGVDLANTAAPAKTGGMAPLFSGADYCNIYSSGLASAFNGAEGSAFIWCKVAGAAVWADGTTDLAINLGVNAQNYISITKHTGANALRAAINFANTYKRVDVSSITTLDWFLYGVTWSDSGDAFKGFYNGAQFDVDKTSLGDFTGTLAATQCAIGSADNAGTTPWNGWLAHCILLNRPTTVAEGLKVYNLGI